MFLGVIALCCVLILGLGMDAERRSLWVDNLPYIVWFPEHLPYFRTTDLYPAFSGRVVHRDRGEVLPRLAGPGLRAPRDVFLAAISYTFYLVHGFAVNGVEMIVPEDWGRPGALLSGAVALVLSIYGSWAIHQWYEEPLRKYGVQLSRRIDEARAVRREAPAPLERLAA